MRIAIMQPYLFPHLPYFQLIDAVDVFVVADALPYRRLGWMNRNRVSHKNGSSLISFPVAHPIGPTASDVRFAPEVARTMRQLRRMLREAHVPQDSRARLEAALGAGFGAIAPGASLVDAAEAGLRGACAHLGITTEFMRASAIGPRGDGPVIPYLLGICAALGADTYVNSRGGAEFYTEEAFAEAGVALRFVLPRLPDQPVRHSVIDWIAGTPREELRAALRLYELVRGPDLTSR